MRDRKDRPHLIHPDKVLLVHRIFNGLASANEGRVPGISVLDAHIVKTLERDPTLINLPFVAKNLRRAWEKANHKVISTTSGEVVFVPSAAITVARNLRVRMDSLHPEDLFTWDSTEQKARANYNRTMDGRLVYRERRLEEFATHPELLTLGEVERALHGYVPSDAPETPFTAPAVEDEDEEDFGDLFDGDEDPSAP